MSWSVSRSSTALPGAGENASSKCQGRPCSKPANAPAAWRNAPSGAKYSASSNWLKWKATSARTLRAKGRAIIGETGVVKGDVHAADLLVLGRLEVAVPRFELLARVPLEMPG